MGRTAPTGTQGSKRANVSRQTLNIMARNSNGYTRGQTGGYERANAKYIDMKQYGVRLWYILGRLLAHIQGLRSNISEMTCRLWEGEMMVNQ